MAAMIPLLRSLVVWLMLLAMPVQGYASATMMACASSAPSAPDAAMTMAAPMAGVHDHAAMLAAAHRGATGGHAAHGAAHHSDGREHDHGRDHGKCADCAACCVGAALVPSGATVAPPALGGRSVPIALYTDALPAVDLAHPERPPQAARA